MRYRYEIDDKNIVRVWDDENPTETGAPFFYQPDRPDCQPWANRAEAQEWVDAFIVMLLTPAPDPETEPEPKAEPEATPE